MSSSDNFDHLEHSDVLRIIGHSHKSFDDAISSVLNQLANPSPGHDHHPHLKYVSFKVVEMGGVVEHDMEDKTCEINHFSVTMDVEVRHLHD